MVTIPNFSEANNSNQLLALLKQNVKYTLTIVANPKDKNLDPKPLPCQSNCIKITVIETDNVILNYSIRHGNTIVGDVNWNSVMNVSYLEDQYDKNKLTKSTDDQGRTVYGMI